VTFRGVTSVARAGETVNIPANAPHSFTNAADRPARLLCMCTPAGQDEFFRAVGVAVPSRTAPRGGGGPSPATAAALAPRYRTELLTP